MIPKGAWHAEGAVEGARRGGTKDESVLREVLDALGDGVARAALAAKLAFAEAGSHGRRYANEDFDRLREELRDSGQKTLDAFGSQPESWRAAAPSPGVAISSAMHETGTCPSTSGAPRTRLRQRPNSKPSAWNLMAWV